MLGMRLAEGVDLDEIGKRSGLAIAELIQPKAAELAARGLLRVAGNRLRPTNLGMDLNHQVVLELWQTLAD